MKVLIVDDEKIICDGLRAMVPWEVCGFEMPDIAPNGTVALEKMSQIPYDILITDVRMPNMDGLTLCQHVNAHYPSCKIIILSGYSDFEYAQKAIEFGVRRYLLKPVDENKLEAILRELREEQDKETAARFATADTKFYEGILPFPQDACEEMISVSEAGKFAASALLKGDMDQCVNIARNFICKLRREKPSRDARMAYFKSFLQPMLKIIKSLNLELMEEYNQLYSAETIDMLYKQMTTLFFAMYNTLVTRKHISLKTKTSRQIALYIQENYSSKLSTSSVAEHFNLSSAYCGRLFKEEQGISIIQYIHTVRIAQAKTLLVETEHKLESIASQVGYTESSNFYSQFKRLVGMTPEQYRQMSQQDGKGRQI